MASPGTQHPLPATSSRLRACSDHERFHCCPSVTTDISFRCPRTYFLSLRAHGRSGSFSCRDHGYFLTHWLAHSHRPQILFCLGKLLFNYGRASGPSPVYTWQLAPLVPLTLLIAILPTRGTFQCRKLFSGPNSPSGTERQPLHPNMVWTPYVRTLFPHHIIRPRRTN